MEIPLREVHQLSAVAAVRQWRAWQQAQWQTAAPVVALEQRLFFHLHVLARAGDKEGPVPEEAEEAFVWLAGGMESPDAARRAKVAAMAGEFLVEDSPRGEGLRKAAGLFPGRELDIVVSRLYQRTTAARPALLNMLCSPRSWVSGELLDEAASQADDAHLQASALYYRARFLPGGLEAFSRCYQPLLSGRAAGVPAEVLSAALLGGLIRGHEAVRTALRKAVEHETAPDALRMLLRLAALVCDTPLYPRVRELMEPDPAGACMLMAIYGHDEACRDLLDAMESPRTAEAAADAWYRISGTRPGRRPRLSLVGKGRQSEDSQRQAGQMPDVAAARAWWADNGIAPGERLLLGRRLTPDSLLAAAGDTAGAGVQDILDLAAVTLGRPLGFDARGWVTDRRKHLAGCGAHGRGDTGAGAGHA